MDEDMKQIRFTIPGQPFGKQRPKFSRAGAYVKTYTPKETTSYENLVKLFYNEAAKGKMFPEDRGNELIAKGKTKQAMNLVSHGLQYYSERVIDSISPYAKNDAGLIVLVLRHLADEVEKNNPGAKELAAGMEKCVGKPSMQEIEKIKKPNRK